MNLFVRPHFEVIDECDDWIVVDKAAPLIVHPANLQPEPTLLGGLEQLLAIEVANGAVPAIITRLDRDTSGLVLVAKTKMAARELGWVFERREAKKSYIAIVSGWPDESQWTCDESIIRAGEIMATDIWVRQIVHPRGKNCITHFSVEERFERKEGKFSLIRCVPETGRMHQIRVHLAHAGYPIVGDKIYAHSGQEYLDWMEQGWTEAIESQLFLCRHALHAAELAVPWKGAWVQWSARFPDDLQAFRDGLELKLPEGMMVWNRADA